MGHRIRTRNANESGYGVVCFDERRIIEYAERYSPLLKEIIEKVNAVRSMVSENRNVLTDPATQDDMVKYLKDSIEVTNAMIGALVKTDEAIDLLEDLQEADEIGMGLNEKESNTIYLPSKDLMLMYLGWEMHKAFGKDFPESKENIVKESSEAESIH